MANPIEPTGGEQTPGVEPNSVLDLQNLGEHAEVEAHSAAPSGSCVSVISVVLS